MAEKVGKYTVVIGEGKPRLASKNAISPIYRYDALQQIGAGVDRHTMLGNPGHYSVFPIQKESCKFSKVQIAALVLWEPSGMWQQRMASLQWRGQPHCTRCLRTA